MVDVWAGAGDHNGMNTGVKELSTDIQDPKINKDPSQKVRATLRKSTLHKTWCSREKGHPGKLHGGFCQQKHSHSNTDSEIGPGGQEKKPKTKGTRPKTPKTYRNSGTLPRTKGFLYQPPYRTG